MEKEYLLDINSFNVPRILKDRDAVATLLMRLILLEPGTFQDHPTMGIGLVSRVRYKQDDELETIKNNISDQIAKYLPTLMASNVDINLTDENIMTIKITVDGILYAFDLNGDKLSLSTL